MQNYRYRARDRVRVVAGERVRGDALPVASRREAHGAVGECRGRQRDPDADRALVVLEAEVRDVLVPREALTALCRTDEDA